MQSGTSGVRLENVSGISQVCVCFVYVYTLHVDFHVPVCVFGGVCVFGLDGLFCLCGAREGSEYSEQRARPCDTHTCSLLVRERERHVTPHPSRILPAVCLRLRPPLQDTPPSLSLLFCAAEHGMFPVNITLPEPCLPHVQTRRFLYDPWTPAPILQTHLFKGMHAYITVTFACHARFFIYIHFAYASLNIIVAFILCVHAACMLACVQMGWHSVYVLLAVDGEKRSLCDFE